MSTTKATAAEVTISDKAFNLAKEWVKNMGGDDTNDGEEDISTTMDARPARLGLGAKYVPHFQLSNTINPVEKKLRAKIHASKKVEDSKTQKMSETSNRCGYAQKDSDDEEDSKSSIFSRKQMGNSKCSVLEAELQKGNKRRRKG